MQSQSNDNDNDNDSDEFSEEDEEDEEGEFDEGDESDEGGESAGARPLVVENNGNGAFGQQSFAPPASQGFGAPAFGAKASFGATTSAPAFGKPVTHEPHDCV